jgi:hypothetical protein
MEQFQNSTDFSLKSVQIAAAGSKDSYEMKQMVGNISYVESVTSPFVAATMVVADSAGLINDLPIQGGETVKIVVETSSSKTPQEYELLVWKIGNRFVKNQQQSYTLGWISVEALNNEYARVVKPLEGKFDAVVNELLTKYLKTEKDFFSESTEFEVRMLPAQRRPFDLISSLAVKAVAKSAKGATTKGDKKTSTEVATVGGSAGFFFWETKRGYNFFSVDKLLTENEKDTWGPYVEKLANQGDAADDRFTIAQAQFRSELDLMSALRKGRYSSKMVFFNHSTGQYSEYQYSLAKAYKDMKHLGAQNTPSILSAGGDKLVSDYPTRIISSFLDHETWFNEPGVGSFEEQDGSDSPNKFCDFHMHFAAQSLMRYELLKLQQATIVIPGNSEICAGDKINIKLVNKRPSKDIQTEPNDIESSGVYLVSEITHMYESEKGANGRFTSTLRLMRDSYGDLDAGSSNHK